MTLLDVLKKAARKQEIMSYKDLVVKGNLPYDLGNMAHRQELGHDLGEISAHCHYQGAPLISALVIDKQKNQPGLGFFRLAEKLGKYNGSTNKNKQEEYWIKELKEVFSYKW
ncbi:MAG: hypothetical protein LAT76_12715 [Schleiferiaceae bacterium]|nr:hypothetical protein [Schleiferiaceae bacterium]